MAAAAPPDLFLRQCLTCAWFRLGDTPGFGRCNLSGAGVGAAHACGSWLATAHATLSEAVAALRTLLLQAAAHPTWPADATLLSAAQVRQVAEQWREAAAALQPALACLLQRVAAELDELASRAESAAPFLPTPSEEDGA